MIIEEAIHSHMCVGNVMCDQCIWHVWCVIYVQTLDPKGLY